MAPLGELAYISYKKRLNTLIRPYTHLELERRFLNTIPELPVARAIGFLLLVKQKLHEVSLNTINE